MQNKDAHQPVDERKNQEIVPTYPLVVEIDAGEKLSKQTEQHGEMIEVISNSDQKHYVIFVSTNSHQEKSKHKWFQYIEKLTGWKIKFFDSFPDLPLLFLDREKKELYINRELIKSGFKEFMSMLDKLVTLLLKQSAEAYQSVSKALHRIHRQSRANQAVSMSMKITEEGLQFPADFSLQANDLQAYVATVGHELIISTANYRMIADVQVELPLTAESTKIILDEAGFVCPLEQEILEKLNSYTELQCKVENRQE